MTDKPISPEVLREAERLLPCILRTDEHRFQGEETEHPRSCPASHRQAVARALQDREDRIAEAEGHIRALIEVVREIEPLHVEDPSSYPCEICDAVRASQAFLNSLGNTMERG